VTAKASEAQLADLWTQLEALPPHLKGEIIDG